MAPATLSSLQQLSHVSVSAFPQQLPNISSTHHHLKNEARLCGDSGRLSFAAPSSSSTAIRVSSSSLNSSLICKSALIPVAPVEAIFFDIDGTLCDSDPIHFMAFQQLLQEVGYNGGVPISEDYYIRNICGKHNDLLGPLLFPDWDIRKSKQFLEKKEALFKKLAVSELKLVNGVERVFKWIKDRGLKHAAITNAPRPSAEFILSTTGLSNFFETVVIGIEWGRPKPFPDPYLKGMELLCVSHKRAFVFEDSPAGIRAGVAAGMPVVGVALRNPPEILLEAGATFTIKDYNDPKLWAALEQLDMMALRATAAVV